MVWEKIRSLFFKDETGTPQKKFKQNLLILLGVGVFLMLFNFFFNGNGEEKLEPETEGEAGVSSTDKEDSPDIDNELIARVSDMLNHVEGVDNASVFLTRESGPEKELATEQDKQLTETIEEDADGGVREVEEKNIQDNYVILRDSREGEKPLVLVEHGESYRGVLVVAEGVENSRVKSQVVEALESILGLPAHRITVLPREPR